MRPIKYRAWDKEANHMYYNSGHVIIDMKGHCFNLQTGVQLEPLLFTGLKDKNGKEIYDGDILDGHCDGVVKVIWQDTSWEVEFADGAGIGLDEMCMWFGNNSEIIGNIYENPELINRFGERSLGAR